MNIEERGRIVKMSEYLKGLFTRKLGVGDLLQWGTIVLNGPEGERAIPGIATIIKIVDVGKDDKTLYDSLVEGQVVQTGEQIISGDLILEARLGNKNSNLKNRISPDKLYVLEIADKLHEQK